MARRSTRLQNKRSSTPSSSVFETAQSENEGRNARLPSVGEGADPEPAAKTPKKQEPTVAAETPKPASQLPQVASKPATTATPHKIQPSPAMKTTSTPKDRTPIKPAGQEMHPAHHHQSTAKVLDEARWLGFQSLGASSAKPKASNPMMFGQATPSKSSIPSSTPNKTGWLTPKFEFQFKSPMAGLSPTADKILEEGSTPGRALFQADEFSAPADLSVVNSPSPRKTAVPKGKSGRYSDVHKAEFEKMGSIANHPSAFRADPSRFKPFNASLKRSPSKTELDKQEPVAKTPATVKRTLSKMDVSEGQMKPPMFKPVATPLKRTQSKMDLAQPNSSQSRAQSTVRMFPPARPQTSEGDSPAKRVKRSKDDDAASTRPTLKDGSVDGAQPRTPARTPQIQRGLPRPTSRLLSPTKASLLRSQSVRAPKTTSMIPALFRTPSTKSHVAPASVGDSMMEGVREGMSKTVNSIKKMKSILRTPHRKFSDDPVLVASGTHMSPPPELDFFAEPLPNVPATAPMKRVAFSSSTLQRAAHDELGKSPSPMKFRAGSEVPAGSGLYPKLQPVAYPSLPGGAEAQTEDSPVRRLTFGEASNGPATEFSFTSDKTIKFGGPSSIRMVAPSNASSVVDGKKRKLDPLDEASDKENNTPLVEDEGRSPKKARMAPPEPAKTPKSASKLPRRTPNRGASISKSRLAFLSTPKRAKS